MFLKEFSCAHQRLRLFEEKYIVKYIYFFTILSVLKYFEN